MSQTRARIQTLTPGKILTFYDIDARMIQGGGLYRYQPMGTNELDASITWRGNVYDPLPIESEGFEMDGAGALPRPTLRVANLDGVIGALVRDLDDLAGARVTRYQVLSEFLDAVNFDQGNPAADPNEIVSQEVWQIEHRKSETRQVIEFELVAPSDTQGHRIPASPMQATVCAWTIGDEAICPYVGSCSKSLTECKSRYGSGSELPARMCPGMRVVS